MSPSPWLFPALSFLSYAVWGMLNGISNEKLEPYSALFYSSFGYLFAGFISLFFIGFQPKFSMIGISTGFCLGAATGLGGFFLLLAIDKFSNTSLLVALTALYPIGTVLLSYFLLNETLTTRQMIGCILSVCAVITMFA